MLASVAVHENDVRSERILAGQAAATAQPPVPHGEIKELRENEEAGKTQTRQKDAKGRVPRGSAGELRPRAGG
jgi:hypothetical protein